jgi:hypothetical protein
MSQEQPDPAGGKQLSLAWTSVALIPLFLVLALLAAYVLSGVLGPTTGRAPVWQDALVGLVALVLVAIPSLAAIEFGRRAYARGEPMGRVPGAVGVTALAAMAILVVGTVLYNTVP